MTTLTNPLGLNSDQQDKLASILVDLCINGVITSSDQYDQIEYTLFGIQMTPQEAEYERCNTVTEVRNVK